ELYLKLLRIDRETTARRIGRKLRVIHFHAGGNAHLRRPVFISCCTSYGNGRPRKGPADSFRCSPAGQKPANDANLLHDHSAAARALFMCFLNSRRAMVRLCTSSGPSARRSVRIPEYIRARPKSVVTPP